MKYARATTMYVWTTGAVLHTQIAVMALNGVSSAAQASLGRSGIELQLLSIIVPTTALQRGQDRKCILESVSSWEEQLLHTVCSQDGELSVTAATLLDWSACNLPPLCI